MKVVAWAFATATLVAAGGYTVVSLVRWEWNRALFFAIVFVAAEVAMATALVLRRLARVEALAATAPPVPTGIAHALRSTRGDADRFPWLHVEPSDVVGRTSVFVTLLVGGGVILSGGAWLLDRLASSTVDPARERRLGRELSAIAYRPGLLVDQVEALARPSLDQDDPRVRSFLKPEA